MIFSLASGSFLTCVNWFFFFNKWIFEGNPQQVFQVLFLCIFLFWESYCVLWALATLVSPSILNSGSLPGSRRRLRYQGLASLSRQVARTIVCLTLLVLHLSGPLSFVVLYPLSWKVLFVYYVLHYYFFGCFGQECKFNSWYSILIGSRITVPSCSCLHPRITTYFHVYTHAHIYKWTFNYLILLKWNCIHILHLNFLAHRCLEPCPPHQWV